MKNELRELFIKRECVIHESYDAEVLIIKFVKSVLIKELEISVDQWKVGISDVEFTITYLFGNIDMIDLMKIKEAFEKYNYTLKGISDASNTRDDVGLILYFSISDNMENETK